MITKTLEKSLCVLKRILDDNDITFWLDFGTLLGAIRSGGIIFGAKDFDMGVFRKDHGKLRSLIPVFKQHGFSVYNCHNVNNLQFIRDGMVFDFNMYEPSGDGCFVHYWHLHNDNLLGLFLDGLIRKLYRFYLKYGSNYFCSRIPEKHFLSFSKYSFGGLSWNVPSGCDVYLTLHYGNWLRPVKSWDFIHDDKTVCKLKG